MQELSAPLLWQMQQWNYLHGRLQNNDLPHALLFTGTKGLGKRLFALAFIKALFCTQRTTTAHACNQCRSCQLLAAQSHPDFYLIEPEEEGKALRIDQIRELILQLNQTAKLGLHKVVLLTPAEAMPVGAANALLKTLEEPSANTIFILLADQPSLLPATIRSRCQSVTFHTPAPAITKQWLQENLPKKADLDLLVALAEGAPLQALVLADEQYLKQRKKFFHELIALSEQDYDPVQMAANWLKHSNKEIIAWLASIITDIIKLKASLEISNSDFRDVLKRIAISVAPKFLFKYLDQLNEAQQQIRLSNPNQQLLLENLFEAWYAGIHHTAVKR